MTSELATAKENLTDINNMTEEQLLDYLKKKAKKTNLPDTAPRSPMLKINYTPNLPGVPFGGWVYNQTFDQQGNIIDPGIHVNNPTVAILAVRYQYYYAFENNTQKPLSSLPFKAFDETAKQYKIHIANKVLDVTGDPDEVKNVKAKHIVYARVNINNDWLPCMIVFKGTNYMDFSSYLKTFKDVPYCTFPTYLPNGKEKKEPGKKAYYVIEKPTHDEKIFDKNFLSDLINESDEINDALDTNPVSAITLTREEQATEDTYSLPPHNNYLPPESSRYDDIPARKIESITDIAADSGLANMDEFKDFVKNKTGLTTLQGLSDANYIKLRDALSEHKAQLVVVGPNKQFEDINEDDIPFKIN